MYRLTGKVSLCKIKLFHLGRRNMSTVQVFLRLTKVDMTFYNLVGRLTVQTNFNKVQCADRGSVKLSIGLQRSPNHLYNHKYITKHTHAHTHTQWYTQLTHAHTFTCSHSCSHVHTLMFAHSHARTCTHSHALKLTLIYTLMLIHAHTVTHAHTHAHTLMFTHAHTFMLTHMLTNVHTCAHTHAHILNAHMHTHSCLHTFAHTVMLTHGQSCSHMLTYSYSCSGTHTHASMLTHSHVHAHTHATHMHTHSCSYTCTYTHGHTCAHSCSHTHVTHVYTLMSTFVQALTLTHLWSHMLTHSCVHTHALTHKCSHMFTHLLTHIHVYTHTTPLHASAVARAISSLGEPSTVSPSPPNPLPGHHVVYVVSCHLKIYPGVSAWAVPSHLSPCSSSLAGCSFCPCPYPHHSIACTLDSKHAPWVWPRGPLWALGAGQSWVCQDAAQAWCPEVVCCAGLEALEEMCKEAARLSSFFLFPLHLLCWWKLHVSPSRELANTQLPRFRVVVGGRRTWRPVTEGLQGLRISQHTSLWHSTLCFSSRTTPFAKLYFKQKDTKTLTVPSPSQAPLSTGAQQEPFVCDGTGLGSSEQDGHCGPIQILTVDTFRLWKHETLYSEPCPPENTIPSVFLFLTEGGLTLVVALPLQRWGFGKVRA